MAGAPNRVHVVQLLTCDKQTGFALTQQGAEFLHANRDEVFHTASFIGTERQGKSTMVSGFSAAQFSSRAGNKGHTKAIWAALNKGTMWLDYEGFAQDTGHNTRLLIVAVMLSNVVVYNTGPQITVDALDKLQAAGAMAAQMGAAGDKPGLLYMLRDYHLDKSKKQTGYLEETMDANPDIGAEIRAAFPHRCCVAIPHPGAQFIENPAKGYPPQVVEAIAFAEAELLRFKNLGRETSGRGFAALVTAVCAAVNSGNHDIGTAWQTRVKAEKLVARMRQENRLRSFLTKLHGAGLKRWEELVEKEVPAEERTEFREVLAEARAENAKSFHASCCEEEARFSALISEASDTRNLAAACDLALATEDEVLESCARSIFTATATKLRALTLTIELQAAHSQHLAEKLAEARDLKASRANAREAELEARLEARLTEKQRELARALEREERSQQLEAQRAHLLQEACTSAAQEARKDFLAQLQHAQTALSAESDARRAAELNVAGCLEKQTELEQRHLAALEAANQAALDTENKVELAAAERDQALAALVEAKADHSAVQRECDRLANQLHLKTVAHSEQFELAAQVQTLRAKVQRLEPLLEDLRAENLSLRKRTRGDELHPSSLSARKKQVPEPRY